MIIWIQRILGPVTAVEGTILVSAVGADQKFDGVKQLSSFAGIGTRPVCEHTLAFCSYLQKAALIHDNGFQPFAAAMPATP
jgi:hypothetical protein